MSEYILLVALVAIATIGPVSPYGNNVRALFGESANALAGSGSGKNTRTKAGSADKTLSNFGVVQGGGSDIGRTTEQPNQPPAGR
ncbi:MAG: hypothetical protein FJ086_09705 [Deltaproteobacteria bacterium]|nr:hypothetical protein [Deltaproteobacteria bacterium]